jgi:hypothetical protein
MELGLYRTNIENFKYCGTYELIKHRTLVVNNLTTAKL